jgi:hypothetical protein
MVVAFIAALGTVVVALLGVFASRAESRDARSRLMKDLEISSKLEQFETKSSAWQVMDRHIARVAQGLVDRERRRDEDRNARRMVYYGIFSAIVVLGLAIVQHPHMADFNGLVNAAFKMFFFYMVVFPVLGLIFFIRVRVERKRRQHSAEQTPEAEAEQRD